MNALAFGLGRGRFGPKADAVTQNDDNNISNLGALDVVRRRAGMEQEDLKRFMHVQMPLRVYNFDTDFMGIVNNTVYARWFEVLRTGILDAYFPLEAMLEHGDCPIISETHIRYMRPITLRSRLMGTAWIAEMGRSRWRMEFALDDHGVRACEAWQEGYYYNLARRKPVPFPEAFVDLYALKLHGQQ